jgi:hypothetical protein
MADPGTGQVRVEEVGLLDYDRKLVVKSAAHK